MQTAPGGMQRKKPPRRPGYVTQGRGSASAARRQTTAAGTAHGGSMARITVEDCQERVDNRFLLVQMAIKRVHQYREGYEALVESRNKEVVTALREIAVGKVLPDDLSLYNPLPEGQTVGGED